MLFLGGIYLFWNTVAGQAGIFMPRVYDTAGLHSAVQQNLLQVLVWGCTVAATYFGFMRFADRMSQRLLYVIGAALGIAGWIVLVAFTDNGVPTMLAFAVLWGVSSGIGAQAFYSLWASELFATPYRASAQGVMFFVVRMVTGLLSYFFPTMLAVAGLTAVGLLLVGLLTVALLIGAIWAPQTRGKTLKQIEVERYGAPVEHHAGPCYADGGVTMNDFTGSLLDNLAIELPSWAFGNSGTRFKVFGTPGTPRTVREKIADAAMVHRLTGLAPTVALHIPWDTVDDYAALGAYAQELGVGLGTINSNTFQDDDYKFGSLTHTDKTVRQKAIDHHLACIEIMNHTGSRDLKIWLADGTNYPGQGDIRGRQERLAESLATIYQHIGPDQRMVLEYKFFEPAMYMTDVPDWGTSYAHVSVLGERAMVCLDTGHHAPGTNIEFIVAQLLRLGKLGSFDFNSRFYADDDLIVGAADPFQLFRIMFEVDARRRPECGLRSGVDAGSVPQRRGQDPRPDPLGAQRGRDDRPRPARRHRRSWPPRRKRATCWAPTRSSWTRSTPTSAPRWPSGAPTAACPPTRWQRSPRRVIRTPSTPNVSAAPNHPGALERPPNLRKRNNDKPHRRRPDRTIQPARVRSEEHQLRRRQHLRQGQRNRSGHR